MNRWTFVFPFIYFLFLFSLAFMDFPRQVNRPWMWIQIGGLIFMIVLGAYFDGGVQKIELITAGVFTLLWLAMAFIVSLKKEYFVLLGLILELVMVILVGRFLNRQ